MVKGRDYARAVDFEWSHPETDESYRVTAVVREDNSIEDLNVRSMVGRDLSGEEWARYEPAIADACYRQACALDLDAADDRYNAQEEDRIR